RNRGLDCGRNRRLGMVIIGLGLGVVRMTGIIMIVLMVMMVVVELRVLGLVRMFLLVAVFVPVIIMMRGLGVSLALMGVIVIDRRCRIGVRMLDDAALHALAAIATTRIAVARAPAAGAVLVLLLGLAMRAFVGLDQRLTIGDRDLVIVGMDFAEGEKAMAIAAIFDKGRLQRRLDARDLGEIDIAAKLLALGGLEIKFFDAIATDHDNPGLLRVGGIDQHFVRHFGTLGGGGRVCPWALTAPRGDATVHLIRG